MDFQLLVTLTFAQPGRDVSHMNTKVLKFSMMGAANRAYENILDYYPKDAIYVNVVKMY